MSFRFRKRVKVLPGIYLNISKSGVSTTIGPRGATLTIGKNGTYLNTGIPGTGISNRTKLFGQDKTIPINQTNPDNTVPETLPINEEAPSENFENEFVTSQGLMGMKEHFEEVKKEREVLSNEISEITKSFSRIQNRVHNKKSEFKQLCETEAKKLPEKITYINGAISNLQDKLDKRQNGVIYKFFTKPENIDNLRSEIAVQKNELDELNSLLIASNEPIEFSLTAIKNFGQNKFLSQFAKEIAELCELQTEANETSEYLKDLQNQLDEAKVEINVSSDLILSEQYAKVAEAFKELKSSNKIWDITSESKSSELKSSANTTVTREVVKFGLKDIDFIESTEPAFYLENFDGSHFYIYPAFILLMDNQRNFSLLDLKDLNFQFRTQRFLEERNSLPSDSKIVDHTWAKINKDGTPDMRIKGNYQIPVVHYGVLTFEVNDTLSEVFHISNFDAAKKFSEEFMNYLALLKNDTDSVERGTSIPKELFLNVKEFGDNMVEFINKVKNNRDLINRLYQSDYIKNQPFQNSDELLNFFFIVDLMRCFNLMADINNLNSKEAFALLYVIARNNKFNLENYTDIPNLYNASYVEIYSKLIKELNTQFDTKDDDSLFRISLILSGYDKDLQKEYLSKLYRFASIVAKSDGSISEKEEAVLKRILSFTEQQKTLSLNNNNKQQIEKEKISAPETKRTLEQALNELNSLIGLNAVKHEINSLINFIKIQKAREATGLKSSSLSYHIVFTGNPGTGKTTVARIIAEIYKELGVLTQGQLVETDRSGLVAEYLGQTAVKVNKTVDSALNGILFIDEAYSLVGENNDDFGKEAVSTLIKRMEDNREKLVVVLAGYSNEMRTFIDTNPGFKSRFNRYIEFADYNPNELLEIYKLSCRKLDYNLTDQGEAKLKNLFNLAFDNRDKSFGNGRYVRNIFEKSLELQANRIASINNLTKELLTTITVDDVPDY